MSRSKPKAVAKTAVNPKLAHKTMKTNSKFTKPMTSAALV